jgi:hypothetical protein
MGNSKGTKPVERVVIPGSMEAMHKNCGGGLFDLSLVNDHVAENGDVKFFGQGFATDKPLTDFSPTQVLYAVNSFNEKLIKEKVKFADLGSVIPIYLGAQAATETPEAISDVRQLASTYKLLSADEANPSVKLRAKNSIYYNDPNENKGTPLTGNEARAAMAKGDGAGMGEIKSIVALGGLVKQLNNHATVAAVPPAIEIDVGKAQIGKDLSIKLTGGSAAGAAGDWIEVLIRYPSESKNPLISDKSYVYRVADNGQGEISFKTKWEKGELSDGSPVMMVRRMRISGVKSKSGGVLCVQSGSGALKSAKIDKADEK